MKQETRYIALSDESGMGGELIILQTNAPAKRLKALEKESCEIYRFLQKRVEFSGRANSRSKKLIIILCSDGHCREQLFRYGKFKSRL